MSEKSKETKKSTKKGNPSRFCAFHLGESRLNTGDPFSLESAHGFMARSAGLQPRYLKKRKCHLHCDETLGIRVQKSGRFRSSDVVPFVVKYSQLERMFVFRETPQMVVLGLLSENDADKRLLIFRFKSSQDSNAFCDLVEQRKSSLSPPSSSPLPFILVQEEAESASPLTTAEIQPTVTDVNKKQVVSTLLSEPTAEYPSSPTRGQDADGTTLMAIQSTQEMEERPYDEEEERMALSRYEEVLSGFDKSPVELQPSFTVETKPIPKSSDIYSMHSLPQRRLSNPTVTETGAAATPRKTPRYATASLGRPRTRQELPPMLFRESQRHKIMYEDIRYLNYGPEGYYETNDGPIFFYVAHMKPDTIQEEHTASEETSHVKTLREEKRDIHCNSKQDFYETTESKRRPYYQTTTTRFVESEEERHSTSHIKENYRSNVETRYNLPEWNMCEMEVKLDLDSEGDDFGAPYFNSSKHSEGGSYDAGTHQQRFVTKTRLQHY